MKSVSSRIGMRFLLFAVIGLLVGLGISEGAYILQKGGLDQKPQDYNLVIPAGTAARIAAGQVVTSLPSNMTFVEGDTLVVENEDNVSHQIGPIWVPPGQTGRLSLDRPQQYIVTCSFQPSNQLGLDVAPRVNAVDRMIAMISVGLPTGILAWLFSLILAPVKELESA